MTEETTLLTAAATPTEPVAAAVNPVAPGQATPTAPQEPQDWRPESLRNEPWLSKYKSAEDALRGFAEAQKLLGKKAEPLAPPAGDAPQEVKDEFNAKLRELRGVPTPDKIAEAYAVAPPEDAPEGYTLNEGLVSAFQGLALEAGLAPAEFKKLADGYMAMEVQAIIQARADSKAALEKEEAALVKEWQAAGEIPKEKFSHALQAAQALGLVGRDGTTSILGHLGNNTALIKALSDNVYPLISEGKLKGGAVVQTGPQYTPKEAMAKGRAMKADPRYADPLKRDPDYVREVDAFFNQHGALMLQRP